MTSNLKAAIASFFVVTFGFTGTPVHASLASNALLTFVSGQPINDGSGMADVYGSYFAIDYSGDGIITGNEKGGLVMDQGITLGVAQPTFGQSHAGAPTGTEITTIDQAFSFGGNTAMHNTVLPITVVSDDGAGNVILNFEGWRWDWNGIEDIDWSGDPANHPSDTGYAILTCAVDCSAGDNYVLDYTSHGPTLQGTLYAFHLEGTISAVPAPAAIWLFGSGLLGFIGFAKRNALRQKSS